MKININKDKSIQLGDLVEFEGFLHFVIYDECFDYGYIVVSLKDFKVKERWETLHELAFECELVEQNNNLKLSTIK